VRLDHRIQVGIEEQFVAGDDRPVERDLLVAVQHPLHVDRHVELVEDLGLHLPPGHREERQRGDQPVVAGLLGGLFVVVGGMVVFHGASELADLLPVHLEVVRIPVVRADDLFSDGHASLTPSVDVLGGASLSAPPG